MRFLFRNKQYYSDIYKKKQKNDSYYITFVPFSTKYNSNNTFQIQKSELRLKKILTLLSKKKAITQNIANGVCDELPNKMIGAIQLKQNESEIAINLS